MPYRKIPLKEKEIYHIFTRGFNQITTFPDENHYLRFINTFIFYQYKNVPLRFSWYLDSLKNLRKNPKNFKKFFIPKNKLVQIICYCLMPNHIHFILKQLVPKGISLFIGNTLNSYSRYFNLKHQRTGPLWEGRFKNILIKTEEQLLHLTRYIHLNPVTAFLVNKPQEWCFSSYKEYLGLSSPKIVDFKNLLEIQPFQYQKFTEDQIDYQRKLPQIKKLTLED